MQLEESMELTKKVRNYIPNDISFDILSKLPMKSLKRFTCVCKFWANLFENHQLMKMYRKHLYLSNYDDHHYSRLLLKQTPASYEFDGNDNIFLFSGETFGNSIKLDWPPPFKENCRDIFIVGSTVNGILCLCQGDGRGDTSWINQKVVLWCPYTEEFNVIPDGSFDRTILKAFPPDSVFDDLPIIPTIVNIHGFGYDPVTDDYKLIRYFCFFDDIKNSNPNEETLWQIYSLKSNCWRDLQVKMPNHFWNNWFQEVGYSMYFHGMCHWWGYEDYFGEEILVSFNLSDEVIIETPFHSNCGRFVKHLVVLHDSIAAIEYGNSFYFFISILGEIGVEESWTRLYRIGPLPDMEPIGVGNNGDIFFSGWLEKIEKFNLNTELIEDTGINGKFRCCQMIV
ncbi:F-box/kelch-repeat protein At3g06240-like [Vicia villosa]|uniref:F-box/kelch-repeat protein At3g06240-like n=1 Tax=Vicia villosa TaxID=3911 RepID=UPI00273CEF2B|nr:F-box/kelch-repeat protein At3g06240-like [Vicia villosa]